MSCTQQLSQLCDSHSGGSSPYVQRCRVAAQKRRYASNPLDTTVLAPRSIRLPLLYQRKQVFKESRGDLEKHGSSVLVRASQPQSCQDLEASKGMLEKVELLMSVFDTSKTGFIGFEDLSTLFSVLADKNWSDYQRFTEWCNLLGADPDQGLNVSNFGKLLSLEPTFVDEAFRLLGLEPQPSKFTVPATLRAELLRTALGGSRSFALRLVASWKSEYTYVLACELSGLMVVNSQSIGHLASIDATEALINLLDATHEFVDATISSVDRWHDCFTGYLKRAALDVCAEKWALFDATWGARIAALLAQVRSVESLRCEMKDIDAFQKVELTWRYVLAVGALVPVLEDAAPHGLILPIMQLSKMKAVAKHLQGGGSPEVAHPLHVQQRTPTPQSQLKRIGQHNGQKAVVQSAARPLGPRQKRDQRAAAYVKRLSQRAPAKSAPATPMARYGEIGSSKRAATAPVVASRYAQGDSPIACLDDKRIHPGYTLDAPFTHPAHIDKSTYTANLAQVLLSQVRSTIGRS